mmetsp:Transcript_35146/g.64667  ORF Transcript_35146/g.64667 Transcript_35146/m.64667 type:complete len:102 (+) Transcript_35146:1066-1371(+)
MVDTFPPLRVEDVTFVTFEQLYAPSSFASSMNQVTGNILDSKEDVSGTVRNRKRNVTPSEERGRPMATGSDGTIPGCHAVTGQSRRPRPNKGTWSEDDCDS